MFGGTAKDPNITERPVRVRVYREDYGDEAPWCIDGTDEAGRYTYAQHRYPTHAKAITSIPDLVREVISEGAVWAWDPEREIRECKQTVVL